MKTWNLAVMLFVLLCGQGCALFFPPPFHTSKTEITKDENGNVIRSTSKRETIGFYFGADKESVRSWADADRIAQGKSGSLKLGAQPNTDSDNYSNIYAQKNEINDDVFSEYGGGVEYISGKDSDISLSGVAINDTRHDAELWFYYNGSKRLDSSYVIKKGKRELITLPFYGTWTAVWKSRNKITRYNFETAPGKKGNIEGVEYDWYTWLR